ncbi:MAG TPA: DUF2490 domain-containing protein [Bacteroidia bacterium]|nr:DUF2490 domain-containing protein [Bacteroidia bacterium]
MKSRLLFFFWILQPLTGWCQVNDAGLWTEIALEQPVNKDLSFELSEELRLNENCTEIGTAFTQFGVDYDIMKHLKAGIAYRFVQKRKIEDFYSFRHKWIAELTYKYKLKKFSTTLRTRYTRQYADMQSSEDGYVPAEYFRTRLGFEYDFSKHLSSYLSGEVFFNISPGKENLPDQLRFACGLEYSFSKKSAIEVGYLIDKEQYVENPTTGYIVTLSYSYKLDTLKKKKKKSDVME